MKLSHVFGGLLALIAIAYPLLIFLGLSHFSVREIALVMAVVFSVRLLIGVFDKKPRADQKKHVITLILMGLGFGIPIGLALWINSEFALRLLPTMINVSMMVVFGMTLFSEPMIERFARMYDPNLGPEQQQHCRQFTRIWVGFFFLNALISLALSWAPREWWAIYTGLVSYALMGILFAGEFLIRRYRFREFTDRFYDRLLIRVIPGGTQ